jgi:UDP-3-O-[3-hydroxymyristoyl] glucosamine N-acyltransferase LpxD
MPDARYSSLNVEIEMITIDAATCAIFLNLPLVGKNVILSRPGAMDRTGHGVLKFASSYSDRYVQMLNSSPQSFVIATTQYEGHLTVPHVLSTNARLDFCRVTTQFFSLQSKAGIEPSASVSESARIGANVYLGHNVVIEDDVQIGNNTTILHNVVISKGVRIGKNCLIKSGTIIGQKGFGFEYDTDGIPVVCNHYGSVVIGDCVEIGSLNTVVAGVLSDTEIADYVKTDDHVHIAHNVKIGRAAFITACAEISGSVSIGEMAWLGPNSSIIDKCIVGSKVFIGIGAVVTKSATDDQVYIGNPARPIKEVVKLSRFLKNAMSKIGK